MRRAVIGWTLFLLFVVTAGAAHADKCAGAKLKAIGKKEARLLGCQAKVAAKNDSSGLVTCEMKVSGKFSQAFVKAGTCAGDEMACETRADGCETMLANAMTGAFPSKCEAAKRKAGGKLAKAELGCYAKAAAKGIALEAACISKATHKFSAALGKTGTCPDGGSPQNLVERHCVSSVVTTDGAGMVTSPCGRCGDGVIDADEDCDDGNNAAGDGCSPACKFEIPGATIFVSNAGNDLNPGTADMPKATVTAGIMEAVNQGYSQLYVANGLYTESRFDLANGVSVFGGYDASAWTPNAGISTLQSSTPEAVLAGNINSPTTLQGFTIQAADGNSVSKTSYGVHVIDSTAVTIRECSIQAGAGGAGPGGSDGAATPATPTGNGGQNGSCDNAAGSGGAGGDNACLTPGPDPDGGRGGDGGPEGSNNGSTGNTSPAGAGGGAGGSGCDSGCFGGCTAGPGGTGNDGAPGAQGSTEGLGGNGQGSVNVGGDWIGTDGGTGSDGSNGGGGGGQGGCAVDDGGGNGAGGGGAGGCGGRGGMGGGAGGGSFGVMASNSTVVLENCSVSAASGGAGGNGGAATAGGAAGGRGLGATTCTGEVGAGGNGGLGGAGGNGRHGGGGGGGVSYVLYESNSVVTESGNSYTPTSGGPGGAGPGPAGQPGDSGVTFP